ncbi:hypothetical protein A2Z33_07290 [Candidatus Gottesmanbacteria bacterium RBG_16_52_11]|uniref:GIY-YIG domain-containing protein n=1 Tax=Candidatus Gottesmanbacteria bacterium RBG_16_52_11 TaxID=1798374 RepID=A0A1F5YY44_9BACT|nr:MAG: hypothetical protein A2Z33_07290 [Candidatus Gottesmanbacteria bacterium RBG_16_52_11]
MKEKPLAFVDIETTGLNFSHDRIIEIAVLILDGRKITEKYSSLVNPEISLPPEIEVLTGISPGKLLSAPRFFDISDRLKELLSGKIFVAHHARFDYGFIKHEFARLDIPFTAKTLCTVRLSRHLYPGYHSHSLDAIISRNGIRVKQRHRALGDARVILDLYRLMERTFTRTEMKKAVNTAMKRAYIPSNLTPDAIDDLPEHPGVYLFIGENGMPLYIGKSLNIRERVTSHFTEGTRNSREMKLSAQTLSIETEKTRGNCQR